jgi:uncharacterized repeat protein (TIGR03803 family)
MTTRQHLSGICRIGQRVPTGAFKLALLVVLTVALTRLGQAQTFSKLYEFTGGADGGNPYGSLIQDEKGDLYGTTGLGGAYGGGTVFRLHGSKESVIYSFKGTGGDGAGPSSGLIWDKAGNLYGTTPYGGLLRCGIVGCGIVFKVSRTGKETVLFQFCKKWPCPEGTHPQGGLVRDSEGNLYGTTMYGGAEGGGTVFELDNAGKYTLLYSFPGEMSQNTPYAGLIRDNAGNLYGTTLYAVSDNCGCGMVFKVRGHQETMLYGFSGQPDGMWPYGDLIRDADGNLYGTTQAGGKYSCGDVGCGTVFKLDKDGTETILHIFAEDGNDGVSPVAGLIRDEEGNLYGTTESGGLYGGGTVFKLDKTGKETILHSFSGGSDGGNPVAALIRDATGNLYGTASIGGNPACKNQGTGCGVVFKISP